MSGLDFSNPSFWLMLANALATLMLWLRRPGEGAERRVGEVETALQVLREALSHKTEAHELAELQGTVAAIASQMEAMRDNVKTTRDAVVRIEDFLRGKG